MHGKGSVKDQQAWGELYEWKLSKEDELQAQADSYLPLFDGMPRVNAYLYMAEVRPNAFGWTDSRDIYVSKRILDLNDPYEVEYVIKHEMTHCWISWKRIRMDDPHGAEFQKKLREVMGW